MPTEALIPSFEQSNSYGYNISFAALPDPGYRVDQWKINNVAAQTGGTTFTLVNVTAPAMVQVTFKPMLDGKDTISANALPSYGGLVTGGGVFIAGSQHTVTATA